MTHLAPHPWDTIGAPPAPGLVYDPPVDLEAVLELAEALREVSDAEAEAREAEDRAYDARSEADDQRLLVNHAALIAAIEDSPEKFRTEDDVRAWLAR